MMRDNRPSISISILEFIVFIMITIDARGYRLQIPFLVWQRLLRSRGEHYLVRKDGDCNGFLRSHSARRHPRGFVSREIVSEENIGAIP
jgi:hypothetical protein